MFVDCLASLFPKFFKKLPDFILSGRLRIHRLSGGLSTFLFSNIIEDKKVLTPIFLGVFPDFLGILG